MNKHPLNFGAAIRAWLQFPWLQGWMWILNWRACEREVMYVFRCRFTFRCFSSELWVKAECVIWFSCCRLEWGLELSPVQFLKKTQVHKHAYILEIKPYLRPFGVCELMWNWSQDPSQINPLQSLSSSVQPIASCWFLNTHTELLVHTQWELALSPDTQTWLAWPRLMTSSHQANRLQGVKPQQKPGELYASVCVGLWEMRARGACAHIPVDGGKESVAFDLLHSIGSGPWRHRSLWFS